jgi:hypothetical protein
MGFRSWQAKENAKRAGRFSHGSPVLLIDSNNRWSWKYNFLPRYVSLGGGDGIDDVAVVKAAGDDDEPTSAGRLGWNTRSFHASYVSCDCGSTSELGVYDDVR